MSLSAYVGSGLAAEPHMPRSQHGQRMYDPFAVLLLSDWFRER